jgi:sugar-specific transcriptional regulator TrmB
VARDGLVDTLQQLGFTQYEAQCYLGMLRQHPLNGSQLSLVSGVPRSMVYQTLNRLEEKAAVVRLQGAEGEPQQYEPVAPGHVIAHLSAQFQATCERVERDLAALAAAPPAEAVLNVSGPDAIRQRATILVRSARQRVAVMGGAPELAPLGPELNAAAARGVAVRVVGVGGAPAVAGQVVSYPGENVSAPTRFLLLIADAATALIATFAPDAGATAVVTANPILSRLFSAFLNTEYYLVRISNAHPALVGRLLSEILEPEDRDRYGRILHFLAQQAATPATESRE